MTSVGLKLFQSSVICSTISEAHWSALNHCVYNCIISTYSGNIRRLPD